MLFATFLGVLFIPIFYVSVRRLLGDKLERGPKADERDIGPVELSASRSV